MQKTTSISILLHLTLPWGLVFEDAMVSRSLRGFELTSSFIITAIEEKKSYVNTTASNQYGKQNKNTFSENIWSGSHFEFEIQHCGIFSLMLRHVNKP